MSIKFKLVGGRKPDYTTEECAALNLYAAESIYLNENETGVISTGVIPQFDQGLVGLIKTSDEAPNLICNNNDIVDASTNKIINISVTNTGGDRTIPTGSKIAKLVVLVANKDDVEIV